MGGSAWTNVCVSFNLFGHQIVQGGLVRILVDTDSNSFNVDRVRAGAVSSNWRRPDRRDGGRR
jgi:hypothetical protein